MGKNITDLDEFTDPIVAPKDGDPGNEDTFEEGHQGTANRTRWLYNNLQSGVLYLLNGACGVNEGTGPFVVASEVLGGMGDVYFSKLVTPSAGSTESITASWAIPRPAVPAGRTVTINNVKFYFGGTGDSNGALVAGYINRFDHADTSIANPVALYYGENTLVAGDFDGTYKEWELADFDQSAAGSLLPAVYPATELWHLSFDYYPKARTEDARIRSALVEYSIT